MHVAEGDLLPKVAMRPIYDIHKSYQQNVLDGPVFSGPLPERVFLPKKEWTDVLGIPIASPIGIPAGPLLTAEWILFAARLGFDLLTYKTIRSGFCAAHSLPNVTFVERKTPFSLSDMGKEIVQREEMPSSFDALAITNSFGNPSQEERFLQEDLEKAREGLQEGQCLLVSVFGVGESLEKVTQEYVRAALLAKEAGAHAIEANFSCPNVSKSQGSALYADPKSAEVITRAISKAIGSLPLVVKVGVYQDLNVHREAFLAMARAGARAVCGLNTVSMEVKKQDGSHALGEKRKSSGICGAPIRSLALDFVRNSRAIIDQEQLPLSLFGCGGVVKQEQFDDFLNAGAEVAMTATGMMWDPYLALRWHEQQLRRKR